MKWLSYRVLIALGWRIQGQLPDVPKMVVVGAPHTSNWDFFLFLAALHYLDVKMKFLAKHSLFRWPFGYLFRRVGGIPVDRAGRGGIVRQVKEEFDKRDRMILVIAPEGTRRAAPNWKSGFAEIAEGAEVPVVFAGVDGANKLLVIGPAHDLGADRAELMDQARAFYVDMSGILPAGKGPVRLADESRTS